MHMTEGIHSRATTTFQNSKGHLPASLSDERQEQTDADEEFLLLLDSRSLLRECLAQSLVSHGLIMNVSAFGSWKRSTVCRRSRSDRIVP
jgi:hypothetical protein